MSKPLVVEYTGFYEIHPEELEKVRQDIKRQAEDGVVLLPKNFRIVENEESEEIYKLYKGMTPKMQSVIKEIMEIEQKGEHNGENA